MFVYIAIMLLIARMDETFERKSTLNVYPFYIRVITLIFNKKKNKIRQCFIVAERALNNKNNNENENIQYKYI